MSGPATGRNGDRDVDGRAMGDVGDGTERKRGGRGGEGDGVPLSDEVCDID